MPDCFLITINHVQGVQGVQGKKMHALHVRKASNGAGFRRFVQGVQAGYTCAHTRERIHAPNEKNILARIYTPAHPAHPAHATYDAGFACAGYFRAPAHPAHNNINHLKMGKKIVCGEENVSEFNALLRQRLPAMHALAKELFQAGMITGIGGMTIETIDDAEGDEQIAMPDADIKHCSACRHWTRDAVGSGDGIGRCAINAQPHKLKWPLQSACRKFEEE